MLEIATACADITPELPIDLSGFALRQNPCNAVFDPLEARWLVLSAAGQKFLLGSADVLSFSREAFRRLRTGVLSETETAVAAVALATSHTHSGPATVPLRHCGRMNRRYLAGMSAAIIESGAAALRAYTAPADVRLALGECRANINRRQGESGPVDSEVLALEFRPKNGASPVILVNYACHPVVLGHEGRGVSADYPGYMRRAIKTRTGADAIFLNGACGDINPRDAHHADPAAAKRMGETLADSVISALEGATTVECLPLRYTTRKVSLPVNVPKSEADIQTRLDMLHERFGISPSLFEKRIRNDKKMLAAGTYPKQVLIELALLEIGCDAAILFVPGELFCSIGLRAKEMAAPRRLLISGFSNGSVGYLSDRKAFAEGGYEPCFANFFYDFPEFDSSLEDHVLEGIRVLLNAPPPSQRIS